MYKIYTLNEQNDNFFIYIKTNKKLVKKKICIHKTTQIDAMAMTETASPFLEENQPKKNTIWQ